MAKLSKEHQNRSKIRRLIKYNTRSRKNRCIPWIKCHNWELNIDDLPNGVLLQIFSYISLTDLYTSVKMVCKKWYDLASRAHLWKNIYVGPDIPGDMIMQWLQHSPQLLNLQVQNRLDAGEILKKVQKYNKNIKNIKIHDCWGCERRINLPSAPLCNILMRCPYLDSISLRGSRFISCKFFRLLASRDKVLEKRKRMIDHKRRTRKIQFYGAALRKQLRTFLKTRLDQNKNKIALLTVNPNLNTDGHDNDITVRREITVNDDDDIERILSSLHFE